MKSNVGKKIANNTALILFMLFLYVPIVLVFLGKVINYKFDTDLKGFTDRVDRPAISVEAIQTGKFQSDFTAWIENKLPLRAVYIRTYNSINHDLFSVGNGNRVVGYNDFVYEESYIYSQLSVDLWDYSDPARVEGVQNMVMHMQSIDNKLSQFGKRLYVYIAPSKAVIFPETIPQRFVNIGNEGQPRGLDILRDALGQSSLTYMFYEDMAPEIEYPTFYPTGIHWSRPYEQTASQHIISDVSELTGRNFRNFEFVGVESSKNPFYRDTDVYDLLNVWEYPDVDYYQYITRAQEGDYEDLTVLICGDSFGEGLMRDITTNLPDDNVFYISRSDYWRDNYDDYRLLQGDYNNLNLQMMLDSSDVVIMEMVDVEIPRNGYGFCEYLDAFLDTYVPQGETDWYPSAIDSSFDLLTFTRGLYGMSGGFTWTRPECTVPLNNSDIANGLEIEYVVPGEIYFVTDEVTVSIYVNDVLVNESIYTEEADEDIIIPAENIPVSDDGVYVVRMVCSDSFVPLAVGINDDPRTLALRLFYLGGIR